MTKPNNSNQKPSRSTGQDFFDKQLPPSTTSTPMPKVKPPQKKSGG
jgi:hypothetical protein